MVSIAGGEPLMHKQIDEIVRQLLDRNKIVFLCTNAVLLPKHMRQVHAAPRTSPGWCTSTACASGTTSRSARIGVFDEAVAAIKEAKAARLPGHDQHDRSSTPTPRTT